MTYFEKLQRENNDCTVLRKGNRLWILKAASRGPYTRRLGCFVNYDGCWHFIPYKQSV